MKLDLKKELDVKRFKEYSSKMLNLGKQIELKEVRITRSQLQSKSLHLFFTMVSNELNELGLTFQYKGLTGKTFELRYTPELVKNHIWRSIQIAMFDIKSTTKIDTKQINQIIDVITLFFSERGVVIYFPSIETLLDAKDRN